MINMILKKAIPAVLMGAVSIGSGQGMEVTQPTTTSKQTNNAFLGINKGVFAGLGDPADFKEFSSERLNYSLPDKQTCKDIIDFVTPREVSTTFFSGGDTHPQEVSRAMWGFFSYNEQLKRAQVTEKSAHYRLPDNLAWAVTSKTTNELVGVLLYNFLHAWDDQMAPQGPLYQFYRNDMQNNIYVNIAYAVSPNHQRQGYSTEMSLALMGTLFQHSNAEVIVHMSVPDNIGSERSAKTCCFITKGVAHGENIKYLRKSSQLRLLDEAENPQGINQPQTEEGRLLEAKVFDLVTKNMITMNLLDTSNINNGPGRAYCIGRYANKLPQNIEELRNWCARGYQLAENESFNSDSLTNPHWELTTEHYSFRLFCYGIHKGSLPLVRYVLENHNNFWDRKNLDDELGFAFENKSFTMITYLIKKDFLEVFDYVIKNKEFRDFTFGAALKNGMGNTPFHTLAKYGSQAMIERFLKEKDLVDLCLKQRNIRGENGMNPLQIAESLKKSEGILNLLREVILPKLNIVSISMDLKENREI